MAKKIKHYNIGDSESSISPKSNSEPDKTKSISELSFDELYQMIERLRREREVESLIQQLQTNSGQHSTVEEPFEIDTKTPINQLYHHGILGMKWGVRRYQNKDGTRTPAGKRREAQPSNLSEDHRTSRKARSVGTSSLSNEELRRLNERLQLEDTYKRLTKDDLAKSESWVKSSMKTIGRTALTAVGTGILVGSAKILIKQISPQLAEAGFSVKEKK